MLIETERNVERDREEKRIMTERERGIRTETENNGDK